MIRIKLIGKICSSLVLACLLAYGCQNRNAKLDLDSFHKGIGSPYYTASQEIQRNNNLATADSIMDLAIKGAQESNNYNLDILYANSLELPDFIEFYKDKSLKRAKRLEQYYLTDNSVLTKWYICSVLIDFYIRNRQGIEALSNSAKLMGLSVQINNKVIEARSKVIIARAHEFNGNIEDALMNFLNGLLIAENSNDAFCRIDALNAIKRFYSNNKAEKKALEYLNKEIEIRIHQVPIDSLQYYYAILDKISLIDLDSENDRFDVEKVNEVIMYAIRNHYIRLKEFAFALLRTTLIKRNDFKKLRSVYLNDFPQEWNHIVNIDSVFSLQLKGYFYEGLEQYDSAKYFYNLVSQHIVKNPDQSKIAKFYINFGNLYMKMNDINNAFIQYSIAKKHSLTANNVIFEQLSITKLKEISLLKGDYKTAYLNTIELIELNKKLNEKINNEVIFKLEADNKYSLLQEQILKEENESNRRHILQYSLMVIMLTLFFGVLILMVRYRVPIWVIKMNGFFTFIFLFEFIILLADSFIHELTDGEPWKILIIKIGLIAFMLPLHHYLEKQIITYLLKKRSSGEDILPLKFGIFRRWFEMYNKEN